MNSGDLDLSTFKIISGGSHSPVLLTDPNRCLVINRGAFDIFAIRNGDLGSRRHFLFRLGEGALLGSLPTRSGDYAGLVAVGSIDSKLLEAPADAVVPFDRWVQWIEALCSLGSTVNQGIAPRIVAPGPMELQPGERLVADAREALWLDAENGGLTLCPADIAVKPGASFPFSGRLQLLASEPAAVLVSRREACSARDLRHFHDHSERRISSILDAAERRSDAARDDWRQDALAQSIARLTGAVKSRAPDFGLQRNNLQAVFFTLMRELGIEPMAAVVEQAIREEVDAPAQLDRIMARHGLYSRKVLLREGWQEEAGQPILAWAGDERRPVALFWKAGRWMIADRGERPLGDEVSGLQPEGLQIYPTLPEGSLRFGDLFRFGSRDTGAFLRRTIAYSFCAAVLAAAAPAVSHRLIDDALPNGDVSMMVALIAGLAAATLASVCFEGMKSVVLLGGEAAFEARMQPGLLARLITLPTSFFRRFSSGDIMDRVLGIQRARRMIAGNSVGALLGGVFSVVSLVPVLVIDARLGVVSLLLAIALAGVSLLIGLRKLRFEREGAEHKARLDGFVLQVLVGVGKLRASASEMLAFARWSELYQRYLMSWGRAERWANAMRVMQSAAPQVAVAILYVAILYWLRRDLEAAASATDPAQQAKPLSAGDFVAISAGFAQVMGALSGMAAALVEMMAALPLVERARPILETAPESTSGRAAVVRLQGAVDIRCVSFRYGEKLPLALDNVSIGIAKGEFIAFVGASGSGKSTLLRMLLGFDRPQSGDVFYEGVPVHRIDPSLLRRQIGVVLQHGRIFSGSIQSNIVGQSGLGMNEAIAAARLVGLEPDIAAMPMGMHTVLLDGGGTLSGGQRQRILIARALVNQPAILLLDEATSALDNRTQSIVTETLGRLSVTRVVIAHRLSTIEAVDRIVMFHRGQIVESGTYAQLMEQNGYFAAHARRQII